jgi:RND superfamily putative drug exporter
MLNRIARFSYRRRRVVVAAWVVFAVVATVLGSALAGAYANRGTLPGTDSQAAYDLMARDFPQQHGDEAQIVFADMHGHESAIDAYLSKVSRTDGVLGVQPLIFSPDKSVAIARITTSNADDAHPVDIANDVKAEAEPLRRDGVNVQFAGSWFGETSVPGSEAIGIVAAIIVLLIAFRSLIAMGSPISTALVGIAVSSACMGIVARLVTTPSFAPQVATMIGIGVGIDYALFIVTRYRTALHRTQSPEAAVIEAMNSSGRAVVFAAFTVMISVLGMFLMGLSFLYGLAVGTSLAVLIAMLAAITLLPALLGFVGFTIDRFRVGRTKVNPREGMWHRWARFVQRKPVPILVGGLALVIVVALPTFGLRLGAADASNDPKSSTTHQAYDLIAKGFGPGANGPVLLVMDTTRAGSSAAIPRLYSALRSTPGVAKVSEIRSNQADTAAQTTLIPTTSPQDPATVRLVHDVRDNVVPDAVGDSGLVVHVGGQTAGQIDFAHVIARRLPIFIGAVLALSFLLLLLVFRSVLVPLKAVVMNLLSIGAAYGIVVAIFQWGWGDGVVGVEKAPIEAWVPMMLFAIVFGLSMDYEVFLLSAIREHYDRTHDNATAVAEGLASTARVITAAALIMVFVFGSFVVSDLRALNLIGLGLAVAVAVDASIVRVVLVPATMELLGDANWWLPRWLNRLLPRVRIDIPESALSPDEERDEVLVA